MSIREQLHMPLYWRQTKNNTQNAGRYEFLDISSYAKSAVGY